MFFLHFACVFAKNLLCFTLLLRNGVRHWKANADTWNNAYLRKVMGETVISVECTPKGKGDYIRKVCG